MRILLAHGDLRAGGGAEAVACAVHARLRAAGHAVDVLDIHGLARADGTRAGAWPLVIGRLPGLSHLHLLKYALVCRVLSRLARGHGAVVLTYGEAPALPCPALTLRHAPVLFSARPADLAVIGAAGRGPAYLALRRIYARACMRIAGLSRSAPATPTLANSRWTARRAVRADPRLAPALLYPPCPARAIRRDRPEPMRILSLGRMTTGKRLDEAVDIANRLVAGGWPVTLDIAGRAGTRAARRLVRRHAGRPGIAFHPDLPGPELAVLMARARLGLHCARHEHFGMAVAEMIAAGIVPVVHDSGGVRELVPLPELRFRRPADAAARLASLLASPMQHTETLARRLARTPALTAGQGFDRVLDGHLARFLSGA